MKLSANLKHEIKLHMIFLRGLVPGTIVVVLGYSMPLFDAWPLWTKIALGALCVVLAYVWFRQCLSPDKKNFTPKWW